MKKMAVVLSGCGHRDGAEITESVSTLIALSEAGADYEVFAPQMEFTVTDPLTFQPTEETRNLLTEAARLARGKIHDVKTLKARDFDGIAFPGGFGAALHLCGWAQHGAACKVHPEIERVIKEFYAEKKPILAICISPALIARVLGHHGVTVTIGDAKDLTAAEIKKTGANHEGCAVNDFVTDRDHRVISTPAYMYGEARPHEVFTGIRKAVRELVEMA